MDFADWRPHRWLGWCLGTPPKSGHVLQLQRSGLRSTPANHCTAFKIDAFLLADKSCPSVLPLARSCPSALIRTWCHPRAETIQRVEIQTPGRRDGPDARSTGAGARSRQEGASIRVAAHQRQPERAGSRGGGAAGQGSGRKKTYRVAVTAAAEGALPPHSDRAAGGGSGGDYSVGWTAARPLTSELCSHRVTPARPRNLACGRLCGSTAPSELFRHRLPEPAAHVKEKKNRRAEKKTFYAPTLCLS